MHWGVLHVFAPFGTQLLQSTCQDYLDSTTCYYQKIPAALVVNSTLSRVIADNETLANATQSCSEEVCKKPKENTACIQCFADYGKKNQVDVSAWIEDWSNRTKTMGPVCAKL